MNRPMTLVDRLRIERVLWTVDILIYDIRTRGRRTIRRELRANLQAAAQEMGAGAAIWQLGPLRRLARGYLDAQYGRVPFSRAGWPRSGGRSSSRCSWRRSSSSASAPSLQGCRQATPRPTGPTCGTSSPASAWARSQHGSLAAS